MEEKKQKTYFNVDFFEDLTADIAKSPERDVEEIGKRIQHKRRQGAVTRRNFQIDRFQRRFVVKHRVKSSAAPAGYGD